MRGRRVSGVDVAGRRDLRRQGCSVGLCDWVGERGESASESARIGRARVWAAEVRVGVVIVAVGEGGGRLVVGVLVLWCYRVIVPWGWMFDAEVFVSLASLCM